MLDDVFPDTAAAGEGIGGVCLCVRQTTALSSGGRLELHSPKMATMVYVYPGNRESLTNNAIERRAFNSEGRRVQASPRW